MQLCVNFYQICKKYLTIVDPSGIKITMAVGLVPEHYTSKIQHAYNFVNHGA